MFVFLQRAWNHLDNGQKLTLWQRNLIVQLLGWKQDAPHDYQLPISTVGEVNVLYLITGFLKMSSE